MGFLLGFIVGFIVSPLLLALVSKPLMLWMAKRQANKFMSNISGRLSGLQETIQKTDDGREENSQ